MIVDFVDSVLDNADDTIDDAIGDTIDDAIDDVIVSILIEISSRDSETVCCFIMGRLFRHCDFLSCPRRREKSDGKWTGIVTSANNGRYD